MYDGAVSLEGWLRQRFGEDVGRHVGGRDGVELYYALGDLLLETPHAQIDVLDSILLPSSFRHELTRAIVLPQRCRPSLMVSEGGEGASEPDDL